MAGVIFTLSVVDWAGWHSWYLFAWIVLACLLLFDWIVREGRWRRSDEGRAWRAKVRAIHREIRDEDRSDG